MSQSRHSTDSQALLQSMLQKLNLQTGSDGQTHLQTAVSTPGQAGAKGVSDLQNNAVSVFDFNKVPPANLKQQPAAGYEVRRKITSFPSRNVSTDGETGESRVLRLDTMSEFTPRETHQSLPAKSPDDVNLSSFKRTYSERMSFSSSAMTNHIPPYTATVSSMSSNPNQFQGFTPAWSHPGTAGEEKNVSHTENGGIGGLKQSTDVQSFSSNQITTNSRKKQRPSENKTRRWTQRIKERWKEKHGKKEKEERGRADQRTEISNPDQVMMAGNIINISTKCEETTPPSVGSCSPSKMFPAQTEDNTRPSADFDIGLGSFSLLDEIIKDQEWGKFINPKLTSISINQRPSEERLSQPKIQPDPFSTDQSPGSSNQLGGGNNQWSFRSPESSPALVAQAAPGFQSVHTDVSQGKQQFVQSELMEVSRNQSDMQRSERDSGPQRRPSSNAESADVLHNAVLKIRGQNSRKRQHQPEKRYGRVLLEKTSDGQKTARASAQMMEDSVESQQGNVTLIYAQKPPPPSPSSPSAPAPRSVLKQSASQDSEATVETLTKRRRVEENRRVHFSEQVVTIASPNMDLDLTDSEEDFDEEDSLTEQECEVEQAATEEAAHARRSALPAWIKALKKMNAGKKHQ